MDGRWHGWVDGRSGDVACRQQDVQPQAESVRSSRQATGSSALPAWTCENCITNGPSQLVPDLAQEVLAPLDLALVLDALRGEPVHHAQDASALVGFGQDDLRGVERVEAVTEEDDEAVSGP